MTNSALKSYIHSCSGFSSGIWSNLRDEIALSCNSPEKLSHDSRYLIREYNKKVHSLGLSSGLYIRPTDAGMSLGMNGTMPIYCKINGSSDTLTVNNIPVRETGFVFITGVYSNLPISISCCSTGLLFPVNIASTGFDRITGNMDGPQPILSLTPHWLATGYLDIFLSNY